jgi:aspartate-semialdehyde dehydrogenase
MMTVGLKPILDSMGLEACMATTLQAISGSGYPGLPMADMWDNVVPHIGGEEEKMESEAAKILGKLTDDGIQFSEVKVSASCNRVPVSDGHLVNVSVKVKDTMGLDQEALCAKAVEAFENFQASPAVQALPSCPEKPVQYFRRDDRPQHRLDRMYSGGMGVSVGRVRPCKILDFKFMVLGHNTIIGAAGGSILNAELFIEKGLIKA